MICGCTICTSTVIASSCFIWSLLVMLLTDDEGDVVDEEDDEEEEEKEEPKPKTKKENVTEWEHLNDNKVRTSQQ